MFLALLLSIPLIVCFYIIYFGNKPKGFPPGPFSWPVFGNLPQIGTEPYKSVMAMRKKYGDIIGIDLGSRRTVFINEYKILKEAFNLHAFTGRCTMTHLAELKTGIFRGIAFSSGQMWTEQRRFAFSYIQSGLRSGKTMENLVTNEISELIGDLKKTSGKPINTQFAFHITTVNTLWNIIAGKRYSSADKDFQETMKHVRTFDESDLIQGLLVFYPKFSKMWPRVSGYNKIQGHMESVRKFMQNIVDDHKRTYNEGVQRDFVDYYLHKIANTTEHTSTFYGSDGEKNLVDSLMHLFAAGTDTVAATLSWLIFLVAHFPEVQKKLIVSISSKSGKSICLQDRTSLPYVEAVIQEVLRYSGLTPLGILHQTMEDVNLQDYKIPKGTVIVANQYGILHDPEVWGDPENFRPERFITEDETEVIRHPALVPFGAGRRVCPGEAIAKDELFLFVTSIFQNFKVEFDPSSPIPPLKNTTGFINLPVPHTIVFHKQAGV